MEPAWRRCQELCTKSRSQLSLSISLERVAGIEGRLVLIIVRWWTNHKSSKCKDVLPLTHGASIFRACHTLFRQLKTFSELFQFPLQHCVAMLNFLQIAILAFRQFANSIFQPLNMVFRPLANGTLRFTIICSLPRKLFSVQCCNASRTST